MRLAARQDYAHLGANWDTTAGTYRSVKEIT